MKGIQEHCSLFYSIKYMINIKEIKCNKVERTSHYYYFFNTTSGCGTFELMTSWLDTGSSTDELRLLKILFSSKIFYCNKLIVITFLSCF